MNFILYIYIYIKCIHPKLNIISCWAILVCDPVGPYEVGSGPITILTQKSQAASSKTLRLANSYEDRYHDATCHTTMSRPFCHTIYRSRIRHGKCHPLVPDHYFLDS